MKDWQKCRSNFKEQKKQEFSFIYHSFLGEILARLYSHVSTLSLYSMELERRIRLKNEKCKISTSVLVAESNDISEKKRVNESNVERMRNWYRNSHSILNMIKASSIASKLLELYFGLHQLHPSCRWLEIELIQTTFPLCWSAWWMTVRREAETLNGFSWVSQRETEKQQGFHFNTQWIYVPSWGYVKSSVRNVRSVPT